MGYQLYYWQAIDKKANFHKGTLIALQRQQVVQQLSAQNLTPLYIQQRFSWRRLHWRSETRIEFIAQLATLLTAGLPLLKSLNMLAQQHPQKHWRCLLQQLAQAVTSGTALSKALSTYPTIFPASYSQTIATAELTGNLDTCCQTLASQQQQWAQRRKKWQKARRYPLLLCILMPLVILIMLMWVLPQFSSLYRSFDAPLPTLTQQLLNTSDYLIQHALPIVSSIFLSILGSYLSYQRFPTLRYYIQQQLLQLPLSGALIRNTILSQLFCSLAMTQHCGLSLINGIENAIQGMQHLVYRQALVNIQHLLQKGEVFSQTLSHPMLFPPLCSQLIHIGENSGTLDHCLSCLAEHFQQQTEHLNESMLALLEPLMILIIGGIVTILVLSIYLPVFQLGTVITQLE